MNHLRMVEAEAAGYQLVFGEFEHQGLIGSTYPASLARLNQRRRPSETIPDVTQEPSSQTL